MMRRGGNKVIQAREEGRWTETARTREKQGGRKVEIDDDDDDGGVWWWWDPHREREKEAGRQSNGRRGQARPFHWHLQTKRCHESSLAQKS